MLKIQENLSHAEAIILFIILILTLSLGIYPVNGDANVTPVQAIPTSFLSTLPAETPLIPISTEVTTTAPVTEESTSIIPSLIISSPALTTIPTPVPTTISLTPTITPFQSMTLTPTPTVTITTALHPTLTPVLTTKTETYPTTLEPTTTITTTPQPSLSSTIPGNISASKDQDWRSTLPDPPLNGGNIRGSSGAQFWEINGTTGSGIYILEQDLTTTSLFGIWVHDVIGVILDGMGYTLHGSGSGDGVRVETVTNIEVRNITVIGWTNGILFSGVTNGYVSDGTVAQGNTVGILAKKSDNIYVKSTLSPFIPSSAPGYDANAIYAYNNTRSGIEFFNVTNGEISSASATNNGPPGTYYRYGVNLTGSNGIIVMFVNASKNGDSGIAVNYGGGNTLSNNHANLNTAAGYYLQYSDSNNVVDNTAEKNGNYGLYVAFVNGSEFSGNSIFSHSSNGAQFMVSENNKIANNVIRDSGLSGLVLYESNGNIVSGNTISENSFNGIEVLKQNNTQILDNNINNNYNGVWLGTAELTTVTGNKVSDNTYSGLVLFLAGNNTIYNNYFNNQKNVRFIGTNQGNTWNIAKTEGTNIVGGPYIGGNYWGSPDGAGYSQVSTDTNYDGLIETPYDIPGGSSSDKDLYPLSTNYPTLSPTLTRFSIPVITQTSFKIDYDAILRDVQLPQAMKKKGVYFGTIRFENSGNKGWNKMDTSLVPLDNTTREFIPGTIPLPVQYVGKGKSVNFKFQLIAPVKPGNYILRFRLSGPQGLFGPIVEVPVTVS